MSQGCLLEHPRLWEVDGSLRDIFFLGMVESDWRRFLKVAQACSASFSANGMSAPLPEDASGIFGGDGTYLLRIKVGGASLNCHFFSVSELELDFDPGELSQLDQRRTLIAFLEELSRALSRPALLTPENLQDQTLASFDPSADRWNVPG